MIDLSVEQRLSFYVMMTGKTEEIKIGTGISTSGGSIQMGVYNIFFGFYPLFSRSFEIIQFIFIIIGHSLNNFISVPVDLHIFIRNLGLIGENCSHFLATPIKCIQNLPD